MQNCTDRKCSRRCGVQENFCVLVFKLKAPRKVSTVPACKSLAKLVLAYILWYTIQYRNTVGSVVYNKVTYRTTENIHGTIDSTHSTTD